MATDNQRFMGFSPQDSSVNQPENNDISGVNDPSGFDWDSVTPLEDRKRQKQDYLSRKLEQQQYGSLSDSYTVLDDGSMINNSNKIYNDLSDSEFQSIFDAGMSQRLVRAEDGTTRYEQTGELYTGPVRRLYSYGAKGSNYEKVGTARGDRDSSDHRYLDYGTGEEGVDLSKKNFDVLLPSYIADTLEGVGHGRESALDRRVSQGMLDLERNNRLGGGYSEFYEEGGFFGRQSSSDAPALSQEEAMDRLYAFVGKYSNTDPYYRGQYSDTRFNQAMMDRIVERNNQKAVAEDTFLKSVTRLPETVVAKGLGGALDIVDIAVSELPQFVVSIFDEDVDIDWLDDEDVADIKASINKAVGYNSRLDEIKQEQAIEKIRASGIDITDPESIKKALTDPEKRAQLGDVAMTFLTDASLTAGMLAEIAGAGVGLGAATKIGVKGLSKLSAKAGKNVDSFLTSNRTKIQGDIAKARLLGNADEVARLERSYGLLEKSTDLLKGSIYTNADMAVRMSNDIKAYKENNNGEEPSAEKLLTMAVTNRIVSSLEIEVLKGISGVAKGTKVAAEEARKGVMKALAVGAVKTVGAIGKGAAVEGIQETVDSVVEQLNQKLGAADYENKSIQEILSEASAEIVLGTVAGAASGGQLGSVSGAGKLLGQGLRKGSAALADRAALKEAQAEAAVLANDPSFQKEQEELLSSMLGGQKAASATESTSPEEGEAEQPLTDEQIVEKIKSFAEATKYVPATEEEEVEGPDYGSPSKVSSSLYKLAVLGREQEVEEATANIKEQHEKLLDGSHSVFGSEDRTGKIDEEALKAKLPKIRDIVEAVYAVNPEADSVELMTAITEGLRVDTNNPAQVEQVQAEVEKAREAGQEFASIKPMLSTSSEVSDGNRGFNTYKLLATIAAKENDGVAFEKAVAGAERLQRVLSTKKKRLGKGLETAEKEIETKIAARLEAKGITGEAEKKAERIKMLKAIAARKVKVGSGQVEVTYNDDPSSGTFTIRHSDVAKKILYKDRKYGYKVYDQVSQELEGAEKAVKTIYGLYEESFGKGFAETQQGESQQKPRSFDKAPAKAAVSAQTEIETETAGKVEENSESDMTLEDLAALEAEIGTELAEVETKPEEVKRDRPEARSAEEADMTLDDLAALEAELEGAVDEETGVEDLGERQSIEMTAEELASLEAEFIDAEEGNFDTYEDLEREFADAVDEDSTAGEVEKPAEEAAPSKSSRVEEWKELNAELKEASRAVKDRVEELKAAGVRKKEDIISDPEYGSLVEKKLAIKEEIDSKFPNQFLERLKARLGRYKVPVSFSYRKYAGKDSSMIKNTIESLLNRIKVTGFTIGARDGKTANKLTREFAKSLLKGLGIEDISKFSLSYGQAAVENPLTLFLFKADEQGNTTIDYGAVEAIEDAVYSYLSDEALSLLGTKRTVQEVADIFGISAEMVSTEMYEAFRNGGITMKVVADSLGKKVLKNLGLGSDVVQDEAAFATAVGMSLIQAMEGRYLQVRTLEGSGLKGAVKYVKGLGSLYNLEANDGKPNIKRMREQTKRFEEELGIERDNVSTYRKSKKVGNRKVTIRRNEFLEAPKDHTEAVNILENTAYKFNSGVGVLLEMFKSEDGELDVDALLEHIIGKEEDVSNYDGKLRYEAQKDAKMRELLHYIEALEDVEDAEIFFNWFIAKNQRMHLDSNQINPQSDKHLARWLLTTAGSRHQVSKEVVRAALEGESDNESAIMFAYSIVQAFDGADLLVGGEKLDLAAVDKNSQDVVLSAAKKILEEASEAELIEMMKGSERTRAAGHVGHAALAIANIRKYREAKDWFESDMVLEVDGLTNGFAFRAMQFPLGPTALEWLSKVGVVTEDSNIYGIESMNEARDQGEEDVYITVGTGVANSIKRDSEKWEESTKKWVGLLTKHKAIPDFVNGEEKDIRKFVRNLMKPAVMVFNYAGSIGAIVRDTVEDQVMGTGYLEGKGAIDVLTRKEEGKYVVSKEELIEVFGKELGTKYDSARKALENESMHSRKNGDIQKLYKDLSEAVNTLYGNPVEETLSDLFGEQMLVNDRLVKAGGIIFEYFAEVYNRWKLQNPQATEKDKDKFFRENASILPGISGASSDTQATKIAFLKSAIEQTNNYVTVKIKGKSVGTNSVARDYIEPGVAPAVLLILGMDASTLAKTVVESFNKVGGGLPVHDAEVLGVQGMPAIREYNSSFYSNNRGYSVIGAMVNALDEIKAIDEDITKKLFFGLGKSVQGFDEVYNELSAVNDMVQEARKELFKKDMSVGQMVGPKGSMVEVRNNETTAKMREMLSKEAKAIMDAIEKEEIKGVLTPEEIRTTKKKLKEMLEGCI